MNISIILYSFLRNGAIRVLIEYANRLSKRGHKVTVYHSFFRYKQKENDQFSGIFKVYKDKISNILNIKQILSSYGEMNFKIKFIPFLSKYFLRDSEIIIFTYWPIAYKLLDFENTKTKVIYMIQAYEYWNSSLNMLHRTYKMGFINVVVSRYLQEKINNLSNAESVVIYPGVNFKKYCNPFKNYFKKNLVISFFYFEPEFKGTNVILEVIDVIKNDYPKVNILCAGVTFPKNLKNYIKYIHNPNDEQIVEFYRETDIFISSSKEEGLPLVVLEAMACQCGVISTRVGIVQEIFESNRDILVFEPGDKKKLFEHITLLINNPEILQQLSISGYKHVLKKLQWEDSINNLENLIRNY
ncbi:MAG: glycosyltransferase family 4 protein [Ignavibacteria bacterium]|nr:glycosyltransferase family 4 protein [Ignavibacteria bacterium]